MTDFVKISYTGRVKDGQAFDTTSEETAKKEGIFDQNKNYSPLPVVVGGEQVVVGLDEALKGMKKGDKKTVEITPDKGYGNRDPNLIRLVSRSVFKKEGISPVPGMPVELDGKRAKIQTVAGGRVRVDFNHELAGKTLVFDVKVEDKATTEEEKVSFLLDRSFNDSGKFDVKVTSGKVEINVPEEAYKDRNILVRKATLTAEIFKQLDKKKVIFIEEWVKEVGEKDDKHDAKGDS